MKQPGRRGCWLPAESLSVKITYDLTINILVSRWKAFSLHLNKVL